jgi:DHA3 family macrolide efflux protein-like MFS transporter
MASNTISVFKNKNYVLLFLGFLVSNLGNMIYNFAISLYILSISNAFLAGIYIATGGIFYFLLAPFGGALVDRFDKTKVLFLTDFFRGVAILIAAFIIFKYQDTTIIIITLFVVTIILAINNSLFGPAARALPKQILEENQLQQSNSIAQGLDALYTLLGAFIGAMIYEWVGIGIIFIVNGVSYIVSGISELFISTHHVSPENTTFKDVLNDTKDGIKYLVKMKPIFYLVLFASLLNFSVLPMFLNAQPYLFEVEFIDLGSNAFHFALVSAGFPLGIMIMSIILSLKKQPEHIYPMMKKSLVGMGFGLIVYALLIYLTMQLIIDYRLFVILSTLVVFVQGLFNGMLNIPFSTAVQVNVDVKMQGRVFSVISVISMGLMPLAAVLGGAVIEFLGVLPIFIFAVVGFMIFGSMIALNYEIKKL